MATMKAAVWRGPGRDHFQLEDVERPVVAASTDVILRVRSATFAAMNKRAVLVGHPKLKPPAVMGRLIAGDIVEVGDKVTSVRPGDRVAIDPERCEVTPGGFAEFVQASGDTDGGLVHLPDGLSYDHGSYAETLSCVCWGALRSEVTIGDTVAVVGCGGVGLTHAQVARLRGATQVIGIDVDTCALAAAQGLGVATIDARDGDVVAQVLALTGGRGAERVIEAVGTQKTYEMALAIVAKNGRVVAFGGAPPDTTMVVDPNWIHYNGIELVGSYHYPSWLFPRAVQILAKGMIDMSAILTHALPLARIGEAVDAYGEPGCRLIAINP